MSHSNLPLLLKKKLNCIIKKIRKIGPFSRTSTTYNMRDATLSAKKYAIT